MRGTMQDEGTRCVIYSVQFVSCSPVLTTAVLQMLATCSCRRIAGLVGDGFSSAQPLIVTNQLRFLQIPNSEQVTHQTPKFIRIQFVNRSVLLELKSFIDYKINGYPWWSESRFWKYEIRG